MNLNSLYNFKCGIKNQTKIKSIINQNFSEEQFTELFEVCLVKDITTAIIHKMEIYLYFFIQIENAMICDEGLEIFFGEKNNSNYMSFFVFLKFKSDSSTTKSSIFNKIKYKSFCYESMVGWFNFGLKHFGCFKGHKDINQFSAVTNSEVANKDIVLESGMNKSFLEEDILQSFFDKKEISQENSFLELSSNFQSFNQNEIVEKINSMDLSWKAAEYEELEGYSIAEIHELFRNGKSNFDFKFQLTKKKSKIFYKIIKKEYSPKEHRIIKDETLLIDYYKYTGPNKSQVNFIMII